MSVNIAVDFFIITFGALGVWSFSLKAFLAYKMKRPVQVWAFAILALLFLAVAVLEIACVTPTGNGSVKTGVFPN